MMMDNLVKRYKEILFFGSFLVLTSLGLGIYRTINEATIQLTVTEIVLSRFLEIVPLLGLGFLKLGIGFAIASIVKRLKDTGEQATKSFEKAGINGEEIKQPFYARYFVHFLVTGILIELLATLVMIAWIMVGIYDYEVASEILHILAVPLEGVGVALLIGGIAFGLATIVLNLGTQVTLLPKRLRRLVKKNKEVEELKLQEMLPRWNIGLTILGIIFSASGFFPFAIIRASYYGSMGIAEPVQFALIWDTIIFVGIAIMLFSISFWLLKIIVWLRAQRNDLGETVSELTGKKVDPIEKELKITKMVPRLAYSGLIWMLIFFFVLALINSQIPSVMGQLIKPGRAISLAILFSGIGLALLAIVINLKLTAFMLPESFSKIVTVIKGEKIEENVTSMSVSKPLQLAPMKLFWGIIVGGLITLSGTLPFAILRMINTTQGNIQMADTFEHIIGPWVSTGVGLIFLMIGLFFSTIVGFVKARKAIITEGVESCVFYSIQETK